MKACIPYKNILPEADWFEEHFKKMWRPKLLSLVLRALVQAPEASKATIPLFELIGDWHDENDEPLEELFDPRLDQYKYFLGFTAIVTVELGLMQCERGLTTSTFIYKINTIGER